jgi:hypothetical protein
MANVEQFEKAVTETDLDYADRLGVAMLGGLSGVACRSSGWMAAWGASLLEHSHRVEFT